MNLGLECKAGSRARVLGWKWLILRAAMFLSSSEFIGLD